MKVGNIDEVDDHDGMSRRPVELEYMFLRQAQTVLSENMSYKSELY